MAVACIYIIQLRIVALDVSLSFARKQFSAFDVFSINMHLREYILNLFFSHGICKGWRIILVLLQFSFTIFRRFPVLLQGETSVGKTSLIQYLAQLTGNVCVRVNNHEHTDLQEYVGFYAADESGKLVFKEGNFPRCVCTDIVCASVCVWDCGYMSVCR